MAAGVSNANCLARHLARRGRWENFRRGRGCPGGAINFNYFPDIFALGAPMSHRLKYFQNARHARATVGVLFLLAGSSLSADPFVWTTKTPNSLVRFEAVGGAAGSKLYQFSRFY